MAQLDVTIDIGERLRLAREQRGLSLEEVYQKTRIHPDVLRALEGHRFEGISQVYLKGFLRRYAECLGLDPQELIQGLNDRLKEAHPRRPVAVKLRIERPGVSLLKRVRARWGWRGWPPSAWRRSFMVGLAACVVAGGLSLGAWGLHRASRTRPILPPPIHEQRRTPEHQSTRAPDLLRAGPFQFGILLRQDAWVVVWVDHEMMFQGVLKAGSKEAWSARSSVSLDANPAEVVEVFVDGRSIGSPGKGLVRQFTIKR